jgi:hypothetical protein
MLFPGTFESPPAQTFSLGTGSLASTLRGARSNVMHLFFDIQHRGDLYLDDESEHFKSLDAACGHLARELCAFVDSGGEL